MVFNNILKIFIPFIITLLFLSFYAIGQLVSPDIISRYPVWTLIKFLCYLIGILLIVKLVSLVSKLSLSLKKLTTRQKELEKAIDKITLKVNRIDNKIINNDAIYKLSLNSEEK